MYFNENSTKKFIDVLRRSHTGLRELIACDFFCKFAFFFYTRWKSTKLSQTCWTREWQVDHTRACAPRVLRVSTTSPPCVNACGQKMASQVIKRSACVSLVIRVCTVCAPRLPHVCTACYPRVSYILVPCLPPACIKAAAPGVLISLSKHHRHGTEIKEVHLHAQYEEETSKGQAEGKRVRAWYCYRGGGEQHPRDPQGQQGQAVQEDEHKGDQDVDATA